MSSNLAAYLSGTQDPSAVATYGETGQVFIQTGTTGFKFFQKQDNGLTTNWALLSTGPSMSFTGLGECIDDNAASVVTLPTGSNNMEFIIKAVQGATVNPSGGNTVEGGASLALAALGFARLRFLNGNWYRIG